MPIGRVYLSGRGEARKTSIASLKGPPMPRNLITSFILAGSIAALATSHAKAQSPDPALLAPGQSGRMMAPPHIPRCDPHTPLRGTATHTGLELERAIASVHA